jgi:putative transposase
MKLNLCYHIIITTKYRKRFFVNAAQRSALENHLRHIAELRSIPIYALSVMPEHVHLMLGLPTGLSIGKAMQDLKWFTSLYLRQQFPELKRHRALWGKRYWSRTIGGDMQRVSQYIADNIPEAIE